MKHKDLAKKAGFHIASSNHDDIGWVWCSDGYPIDEQLEAFAELVRADERAARGAVLRKQDEQIKEMQLTNARLFEKFNQAVLAEREACARLVEEMAARTEDICRAVLEVVAENIRERWQK